MSLHQTDPLETNSAWKQAFAEMTAKEVAVKSSLPKEAIDVAPHQKEATKGQIKSSIQVKDLR